jgi:hypothetical protein
MNIQLWKYCIDLQTRSNLCVHFQIDNVRRNESDE